MSSLIRNPETDFNEILVDWIAPTAGADGDSAILGYHVQYRLSSSETWLDVILPEADYTLTTARVVDDVVPGELYAFRARSRNVYGFGPFSD